MKRLTFIIVAIAVTGLLAPCAFAQDEPAKLIEEAKDFFAKKKWAKALNKLKLAQQVGVEGESVIEVALHIGAIYAEIGQKQLAQQNLKKFLNEHPTTEVPDTFTEKMAGALEESRLAFPIVSDISLEKGTFKPYREKLGIGFTLKASESVLAKTTLTFKVIAEARDEVLLDTPALIDAASAAQQIMWDGKSKYAMFVENADYVFEVEAVREDGWKHSAAYRVKIGGNLGTAKVLALRQKAQRIESLSGKRRVSYLPDKDFVKIGQEPLKSSMKGFWNYVFYIPLGAIRDGLDFPLKWLLSLKGVGHVLTATAPVVGGYSVGQSLWKINKDDYYDPMLGFDEDSWDHDKDVIQQRSMATGILGPVWALAYAGVMSVVSWTGTEGGIAKGFSSYIDSNAFRNGYDPKYFFPNYRGLDFSTVRADEKELARLEARVRQTNQSITAEISAINREVDTFNHSRLQRFKREITARYNKELYDFAEMTIESNK